MPSKDTANTIPQSPRPLLSPVSGEVFGTGVAVGAGVPVGAGVAVGVGVNVGAGVSVGCGIVLVSVS